MPKKGRKFSVRTQSRRKKRFFKGTRYADIQQQSEFRPAAQNESGDHDAGVDGPNLATPDDRQVNPEDASPVTSASRRKIEQARNVDDKETAETPKTRIMRSDVRGEMSAADDLGYRLVYLENIRKVLEDMHGCKGGMMLMTEDVSKRRGLSSKICFECTICSNSITLETNKTSKEATFSSDVNLRSVFAVGEIGLGREGLSTFCEILDMPPPIHDSAFQKQKKKVHSVTKTTVLEKLQEAAKGVRSTLGQNDIDIIDVAVSFDGTWSRRGFSANFGIAFVISTDTGEVLDYAVMSKMCEVCKAGEKLKSNPEKYKKWKESHESSGLCQKNYNGSSSSMETDAAKILWGRSVDLHKFRYRKMVCDGDSKAYSDVWNIYGVCKDCEKFEKMNKKSPEYEKWLKSASYKKYIDDHSREKDICRRVDKLDCIGHVQKRMGKNLIALQSKQKLEDGKPVGGRSGRLTRPVIDKIQKYYGNAIRSTVDRNATTKEQKDKAIEKMQTAIKAVLYHSIKLDNQEERHKFCPKDSWCQYQNSKAQGNTTFENKPHHLDAVFLGFLSPLFERLSAPALLARCLPGFSQNVNESINALVWNRCPKSRNKGLHSIETAAGSAILQFNLGATSRHAVMQNLGMSCGKFTLEGSHRKDKKRVKTADNRQRSKFKMARQKIREAKLKEQERLKRVEGVTYEAGGFNEDMVIGNIGKSRKRVAGDVKRGTQKRKK